MELYCPHCQKMVFATREGHRFFRCQQCKSIIKTNMKQLTGIATGTFGYERL